MSNLQNPHVALRMLDNPTTPCPDLEVIAKLHPSMHAQIAAHPMADKALLAYIVKCGDPEATRIATQRLARPPVMPVVAMPAPVMMPVLVPPRQVVKRDGWTAGRKAAVAVLAAALAVTGVASVYAHSISSVVYEPPERVPPAVQVPPVPPIPGAACLGPTGSWMINLCGTGTDQLLTVAVTGNGLIIAGGTTDSVDGTFSGAPTAESGTTGVLATVGDDGVPNMLYQNGSVRDSATDSQGNVVVVGTGLINGYVGTISKYDAAANLLWTTAAGDSGYITSLGSVAIDREDSIIVWGLTDPLSDPDAMQSQVMVSKYTPDGNLIWTSNYGAARGDLNLMPTKVAVTGDGNIFLVGNGIQASGNNDDARVAMINNDGQLQWTKTYGGSGAESFNAVIEGNNGNALVVGNSCSQDGPFATVQGCVGVVGEIDTNGNLVSSRTYGTDMITGFDDIIAVGNTYAVVGYSSDVNNNANALVMLLYDPANSSPDSDPVVWSNTFGGSGEDRFFGAATAPNGDIVVVGTTDSTDGTLPPSIGGTDAVIVMLTPGGNVAAR